MVDPTSFSAITKSVVSLPYLKGCIAAACAVLTHLVGPDWIAYEVLLVLVLIDVITGTMNAIKKHNVSSLRFFQKGIYLLLYFLILISAHQLERLVSIPFIELEIWSAYFLAVSEFISILENSAKLGVPFPGWITKRLEDFIHKEPSQ